MAIFAFAVGSILGIIGTLAIAYAAYCEIEKTAIDTGEIELDGEWYTITKRGNKNV